MLLLVTIDAAFREEDFLVLKLAKSYNIETVIVRTKLDEWLDSLSPNNCFTTEQKLHYVENGKA